MAVPRGQRSAYAVTPALISKVEALAATGLTIEQICSVIGWCPDTLYRKKKTYSELSEALRRGQDRGVATITNALFQSAKQGNLGAQVFYLKNRAGWRDKFEQEVTGADGGAIKTDNSWTIRIIDERS